jgi:hypothetical protein
VVEVVVVVVVVGSRQPPNQPWDLQVVELDVVVEVVDGSEVVDLSLQRHHPGVEQVCVLVAVLLVGDGEVVVLVAGSDPLLLKNFQLTQSRQSVSGSHLGTPSYFSMTSEMTARIRWVPMPTRQPKSSTVS